MDDAQTLPQEIDGCLMVVERGLRCIVPSLSVRSVGGARKGGSYWTASASTDHGCHHWLELSVAVLWRLGEQS